MSVSSGRFGFGLVVLLACALATPASADQNDGRLDDLFKRLAGASESGHSSVVERQIWGIWIESGDVDTDELMRQGIASMAAGELLGAIGIFNAVVQENPGYAEGWNKRATALFYANRPDDSMRDIQRTLALEPRHFGAIAGMGLIFLSRGDLSGALMAFEAVLKVNPSADFAKEQVKTLRKKLEQNRA
jgi:tetratricopeptide (TPR) repeat protein